jgi:dihydropyrimidinase
MTSLLVRGGLALLPDGARRTDLLVRDGVIAEIGPELPAAGATRTIDASGALVLPGGIDAHVHLQTPQGALLTRDDFTSGTAAAALGGTTTVAHFCIQEPGERLSATLRRWHGLLAAAPPIVDVGFHVLITDLPGGTIDDLAALPAEGVTTFKVFMAGPPAIPPGDLLRVMQVAARTGARVMVHAEDGDAIDVLIADALAAGHVDPVWHARTRPPATESIAAARAIAFARLSAASLYLVHVTTAETVAAIAAARDAGLDVVGETCPQYLLLDPSCLEGDPGRAARMIFTPPPREAAHREALWRGLRSGALSVVASDHSAFTLADKAGAADFTGIAQGLPGVQTRMSLLHHHGVRAGRISEERFVELTAAAPARHLGLWPRKGALRVGSDADVVVFDPERRVRIGVATHHMASDYSPYEGMEIVGAPRTVLAGGRVVVDDGVLVGAPGDGRFVARDSLPAR